jgi:hypothetical protein
MQLCAPYASKQSPQANCPHPHATPCDSSPAGRQASSIPRGARHAWKLAYDMKMKPILVVVKGSLIWLWNYEIYKGRKIFYYKGYNQVGKHIYIRKVCRDHRLDFRWVRTTDGISTVQDREKILYDLRGLCQWQLFMEG